MASVTSLYLWMSVLLILIFSGIHVTADTSKNETESDTKAGVTKINSTLTTSTTTATPATTLQDSQSKATKEISNANHTDTADNATTAGKPKTASNGMLAKMGIKDENFDMYVRAFYVVVGVAAIVVVYLGVKTFVLRKRQRRSYGVLTNRNLELRSLHNDDDEEEELFDRSDRRLLSN